jgi:hypothetical protein
VVAAGATLWLGATRLTGSGNGSAAQSNLQNAQTAANVYYNDSGHTFSGLTDSNSSTVSSIQELGSGLSYVSGATSGGATISIDVGGDGSYLVLTDFEPGALACVGILDVTQPLAKTVLGISRSPGTYFFVTGNSVASACNAANITTVSASSTSGFPNA